MSDEVKKPDKKNSEQDTKTFESYIKDEFMPKPLTLNNIEEAINHVINVYRHKLRIDKILEKCNNGEKYYKCVRCDTKEKMYGESDNVSSFYKNAVDFTGIQEDNLDKIKSMLDGVEKDIHNYLTEEKISAGEANGMIQNYKYSVIYRIYTLNLDAEETKKFSNILLIPKNSYNYGDVIPIDNIKYVASLGKSIENLLTFVFAKIRNGTINISTETISVIAFRSIGNEDSNLHYICEGHFDDRYSSYGAAKYDTVENMRAILWRGNYIIIHRDWLICRWCMRGGVGLCVLCGNMHGYECKWDRSENIILQTYKKDCQKCGRENMFESDFENIYIHKSRIRLYFQLINESVETITKFLIIMASLISVIDNNNSISSAEYYTAICLIIASALLFTWYDRNVEYAFSPEFIRSSNNYKNYNVFYKKLIQTIYGQQYSINTLYSKSDRTISDEQDGDCLIEVNKEKSQIVNDINAEFRNLRMHFLLPFVSYFVEKCKGPWECKNKLPDYIICIICLALACVGSYTLYLQIEYWQDEKYDILALAIAKVSAIIWLIGLVKESRESCHMFSFGKLSLRTDKTIKKYISVRHKNQESNPDKIMMDAIAGRAEH